MKVPITELEEKEGDDNASFYYRSSIAVVEYCVEHEESKVEIDAIFLFNQ